MKPYLLILCLAVPGLRALPAMALQVVPARTEVRLTPGTSTQVSLTVTNDDQMDLDIEVSQKDWFIPEAYKEWTVDKWLKNLGEAAFVLKPAERRKVDLMVRCPKTMDGEVVGMVSFVYRTRPPSMVTPMISVSMYLIGAGSEKIDGSINDLYAKAWSGRLSLSAKVRSTGNVHMRPSGYFLIVDRKGREIARMPILEGQPTYPGQESLYTGQTPGGLTIKPGKYVLHVDLRDKDLVLKQGRAFKVLKDGQVEMGKVN